MNKKILGIILIALIISITGCGFEYPEPEDDFIGFETKTYIDESDDAAGYLTIEYDGRTYLPYGSLNGVIREESIDKCLGYIIQDENNSQTTDNNNKNTRIYTLTIDPEHNFLMEYNISSTLMNDPSFYRAIDTKGKNINIPKYINDLNYNYWK